MSWFSSKRPSTDSADAPNASRLEHHQILAGRLGHLNDAQQAAFASFKADLAAAKLYTPGAPGGEPSHDDSTLLRFLRARKFDPKAAQKQFAATELWRKEHDVDRLYATFDPDEFEAAKHFYPRWTGRRDKTGHPVYVFHLASLQPLQKDLNAVPPERRYQRIVALWEFMRLFALPLSDSLPRPNTADICAVTSIIDLADVSLPSLWALRHHLQEASGLATAHYPECMHSTIVVNSPSFFPTVWGWIKAWFDEGTRLKVHVLGRDPGPTLRQLIDADNLPKAYGGNLDFTFRDEPVVDDVASAALWKDAAQSTTNGSTPRARVPRGPIVYRDGKLWRPRVDESGTVVRVPIEEGAI
ncbi:CRAL-TRIO domain-containing protein [Schizophyllum fasciatum]